VKNLVILCKFSLIINSGLSSKSREEGKNDASSRVKTNLYRVVKGRVGSWRRAGDASARRRRRRRRRRR
jgi:hypothetical protein